MADDVLAVSRPRSAVMEGTAAYIDTDTRIGDDTVAAPGFRKHLEAFCSKASPEDRARCLELITAIDISEEVQRQQRQHAPRPPSASPGKQTAQICVHKQRRPKTAMAALDRPTERELTPYNTTYGREYSIRHGEPAQAERPGTSRILSEPFYDPNLEVSCTGSTTYHNSFWGKTQKKQEALRTGTASGNRRNNPHPLQAFMVWRFPQRRKTEKTSSEWNRELTDDAMDRVIRGQLRSTYQSDFIGCPQGMKLQPDSRLPEDWKARVPYTLDSMMRHTYRRPTQPGELKGNTSRYGCNTKKTQPALGAVPTVSMRQMNLKTRTTYEREYNDTSAPPVCNVRDLGRQYGGQALQRHLAKADCTDKEEIARMLESMSVRSPSVPRTPHSRASSRPAVPMATACVDSTSRPWMSPPPVATPIYN